MKKIEIDGHIYSIKYEIGQLLVLQNEKECYLYEEKRGIIAEVKKCTPPPIFVKKINGSFTFMGLPFKVIQKTYEGEKIIINAKLGKTQFFFHILEEKGKIVKVTFPIFD